MVVLDELAQVPWLLDRAVTNMPAVGRGDRWCNPEKQQQEWPHDAPRSPDSFSSDVRGTQLSHGRLNSKATAS